jgi:putative redox protein
MKHKIKCKWINNMAFEAEVNDHRLVFDTDETSGGENKGPKPKTMLLASLAGCTAMDVISILKKMRIEPSYFNVVAEGELTEEHPRYFHHIHLIYEFRLTYADIEKLGKAIELSQEKYCGVTAMLSKAAEITYEIKILE